MGIRSPQDLADKLIRDFSGTGDPFLSMFFFGPSATSDYQNGGQIDLALTYKEVSGLLLSHLHEIAVKWAKQKVVLRYIFTPDYVENSLDTFPIEFLDMKARHLHLDGVNWLPPLAIPKKELRLQCERELRGLALHLRSEWVHLRPKASAFASLTRRTRDIFHPIFRGLLELRGKTGDKGSAEIFSQVEKEFGITNIFTRLVTEEPGKTREERQKTFDEWAAALDTLIRAVDGMK
ncbi:MAG: hypothetical protein JNM63_19720 [Spirochaetia bacterium]|nr:hypothetical protein [Spirochaetia bacterium]